MTTAAALDTVPPQAEAASARGDSASDVACLVILRIVAGLAIVAFSAALLFRGHPFEDFLAATRHYPYRNLEWVKPLPPNMMRGCAVLLGLSGAAMAAGFRYRIASAVTAVLYTYFFFVDAVYYDSVGYFVALMLALLAASPAHALFSMDARAKNRVACRGARLSIGLLRFQVACLYIFSGISKCYGGWLSGRAFALMVPKYALAQAFAPRVPPQVVFMTIAVLGALLDFTIVPLLCFRVTRRAAFVLLIVFHVHNAIVMPLGAVPWIMLAASTVFFPTGWPRVLVPSLPPSPRDRGATRFAKLLAVLFVVVQVLMPLRRWITPGDPAFHEIGYEFTWALRSREKEAGALFRVVDRATGKESTEVVFPHLREDLALSAAGDPFLIWWSAQRAAEGRDVAVYVTAVARINGDPGGPLIDRTVDLSRATFPCLGVPSWVMLRGPTK